MYEWTQKRIEWYERAIDWTGYDILLAEAVKKYLWQGDTVCDLGCGTGYLGLELSRHGYDVSAVDISLAAMDCLAGKPESKKPGFEMLNCSWEDVADRRWDNVIMCLTGNFEKELPYYLSLCKKNLIVIYKKNSYLKRFHPLNKKRPVHSAIIKALEKKGLPYTLDKLFVEFGQPLTSLSEAEEYLQYYGVNGIALKIAMKRLKFTGNIQFPYYLPYKKELGICILKKQEIEIEGSQLQQK